MIIYKPQADSPPLQSLELTTQTLSITNIARLIDAPQLSRYPQAWCADGTGTIRESRYPQAWCVEGTGTIRDFTKTCDNRGPMRLKVSAIDTIVKTIFERLYSVSGMGTIGP